MDRNLPDGKVRSAPVNPIINNIVRSDVRTLCMISG